MIRLAHNSELHTYDTLHSNCTYARVMTRSLVSVVSASNKLKLSKFQEWRKRVPRVYVGNVLPYFEWRCREYNVRTSPAARFRRLARFANGTEFNDRARRWPRSVWIFCKHSQFVWRPAAAARSADAFNARAAAPGPPGPAAAALLVLQMKFADPDRSMREREVIPYCMGLPALAS